MTSDGLRVLTLEEYRPKSLARSELSNEEAAAICRAERPRVHVDAPKPWAGDSWTLVSEGWVGYLPVTPTLGLSLQPKVPLANLFRMLEYAYNLESFHLLDGEMASHSLEEFYERLANVLAQRVLERMRKGLYASYVGHAERLPYVRGAMDLGERLRKPWATRLTCHYQEHTPDLEENQILTWTLGRIAQSGLCSDRVLPNVRRAFHALQGVARSVPFSPRACVGRLYSRLNSDYEPLHALCRFFLEHTGPTHEVGERKMIPFVVNMARLYERFVAEWLARHLPSEYELRYQEHVVFGEADVFSFDVDMVLFERRTSRPLCVLDAKYKVPDKPAPADIAQVVAYAEALGCQEAALVYPQAPAQPLLGWVGGKRVRTLVFGLSDGLQEAGLAFMEDCLNRTSNETEV